MVAEFEANLGHLRAREGMALAKRQGKLKGKQPKLSRRHRWGLAPPFQIRGPRALGHLQPQAVVRFLISSRSASSRKNSFSNSARDGGPAYRPQAAALASLKNTTGIAPESRTRPPVGFTHSVHFQSNATIMCTLLR
ncbi:hypothetical protein Airi02_048900 [Actinoallomurus iriomotensis]|uniref:Resolvase/invertase-type recombinase catalytic domain-containing protein n=1 Tax=Actinoallomurus iriomotensis TaxID=478107 RepID=A0A9W6W2H6_9ACTN|nr:hypothetical protein Airi02_048900 [Actinoallomurus iriomotensis]